jgi:hypothetical protein
MAAKRLADLRDVRWEVGAAQRRPMRRAACYGRRRRRAEERKARVALPGAVKAAGRGRGLTVRIDDTARTGGDHEVAVVARVRPQHALTAQRLVDGAAGAGGAARAARAAAGAAWRLRRHVRHCARNDERLDVGQWAARLHEVGVGQRWD